MTAIPDDLLDLVERPLFGALGTIRPNDTVQVNPMWFEYDADSDVIRFTHTTKRQKYRNLRHNPAMSLLVIDPADPLRFLEVRGRLVELTPDPTGAFYVRLGVRYGDADQQPPADRADRVILTMSVERTQRK
ncbi:PPOX class F420-dependent oxidoreductase [Agromyces protaetiae]|uniref:PPOX class F420-dependent oxidoreductase n=1 Tax=Agromyces protaetiae TaxID=2509455 RepID=A0A4P6FE12_9MICO|nr:PPOX class F420-dependent oxidoreductase [Agromyces protaetiae]QAY74016.1 PPOX class F420-dependent oxidoreductase [Agromyces protaetiae]